MRSDWLSPILVKELRQGMRARVFEGSFILLQVLMVITMLGLIVAAQGRASGGAGATSAIFWTMVAIPVLFVMPLRGSGALRGEIDAKTLELMFLTRLSAWRIVFGKWAALFAQSCLLVCAVLPYVVMRYFVGGIEVTAELQGLFAMLVTSGLLLAMTVALSSFQSKLLRAVSFALPIGVVWFGMVWFSSVFVSIGGVSSATGWAKGLAFYALFALIVVLYCLELGASRIGPAAENHETRKRLLGIAVVLLGPILVMCGVDDEILWLGFVMNLPVCFDALCRPWRNLPVHYVPFTKWPVCGRISRWFLLPGWPAGVFYTFLTFGFCIVMLTVFDEINGEEGMLTMLICLFLLLLPLAVLGDESLRGENMEQMYLAVLLGVVSTGAILFALLALIASFDSSYRRIFNDEGVWLVVMAALTGLVVMAVLARRGRFWDDVRELPDRARGMGVRPVPEVEAA